ncbi:MAG: tripartite tricarboxylate transporter TctB family protein [Syntrophaceae bacterium]
MDKQNIISSIIWLCVSTAVLIASVHLGIGPFENPGPGFMGFWAAALLSVFSGALLLASLPGNKKISPADLWNGRKWSVPLLVTAAIIIYCLALPKLGYLPATLVLVAVLFLMGGLKLRLAVPGALVITLLTFVLFDRLLKMPLPRGLLGF